MASPGHSSDEAPEENTLAQGRENAQLARRREHGHTRRAAAEAKDRRRKHRVPPLSTSAGTADVDRSILNSVKKSRKLMRKSSRQAGGDEKGVKDNGAADSGNELKFLDSQLLNKSVLEALAEQERNLALEATAESCKQIDVQKKHNRKRRLKKEGEHAHALVTPGERRHLPLLSEGAVQFRRQQLYGAHIRRSRCMLAVPKL